MREDRLTTTTTTTKVSQCNKHLMNESKDCKEIKEKKIKLTGD